MLNSYSVTEHGELRMAVAVAVILLLLSRAAGAVAICGLQGLLYLSQW